MKLEPYVLISALSPIPAIIAGLWRRKVSLFWLYAITDFVFDMGIILLKRVLHVNGNVTGNIFFMIEFCLIAFIVRPVLFRSGTFFKIQTGGLLICYLVFSTVVHSVSELHLIGPALIFSLPYILYALAGFNYLVRNAHSRPSIETSSFFWFNSALMIYASGSIVLFLFHEYLLSQNAFAEFKKLWLYVFITINIIKNLLLIPAVYFYRQEDYERH